MSVTCYSVGFFGQLWGTQGYPGVLKGTQGSSGVLQLTPGYFGNCQAKVQTKPRQTPNSKFQTPDSQSRLEWHYNWKDHPPHPTQNFWSTSRVPTTKCYTFLETSHGLRPKSQLRWKIFATFCNPIWQTQSLKTSESSTTKRKRENNRKKERGK